MSIANSRKHIFAATAGLAAAVLGFMHTAKSQQSTTSNGPPPDMSPAIFQHAVGNAAMGQNVFRYTTFGNQGFWTTAMQLPQGIAAAKITPLQALQFGLNVNIDAVNPATQQAVAAALQQVLSGTDPSKTAFGDPNVTLSLINQNAVMGW
jgi:hypothetical protein